MDNLKEKISDVWDWFIDNLGVIIAVIGIAVTLGIIGVFAAATISNEKNWISAGTVIDKDYNSAYTSVYYTKSGNTNIPHFIHRNESYKLKIKGEKDGKVVEYWFECTEEEYQNYNIGDYYSK